MDELANLKVMMNLTDEQVAAIRKQAIDIATVTNHSFYEITVSIANIIRPAFERASLSFLAFGRELEKYGFLGPKGFKENERKNVGYYHAQKRAARLYRYRR